MEWLLKLDLVLLDLVSLWPPSTVNPWVVLFKKPKAWVTTGLQLISSTTTPHVDSDQTDFDIPQVGISSLRAKYEISLRL